MIKRFYLSGALLLLFCLNNGTASAETPELAAQSSDSPTSLQLLFLPPFSHSQSIQKSAEPVRNTFLVNLGPKVVELKASYLERREESNGSNGLLDDGKSRYFDLLATSSYLDGKMIAEGELAYSALDSLKTECHCDELPRMMRLGLKHRWGDFSYGADYRSLAKGFVSITGARVDQPRDEAQLWGERSLGPFKFRGSFGESWEKLSDIDQLKLTKIAAAALNFNRPEWGGWLASSYSLTGGGADLNQEITAFTNTFVSSYRPLSALSLGQNFSIKEERDQSTGIRTETPAATLTVVYTPWQDLLKLSGGGSYTRTLSKDRSGDVRTVGTTAAMDWKIGKSMAGDEFLSFNVTYNHQLDFLSSTNSHEDLSATLRYKIIGF